MKPNIFIVLFVVTFLIVNTQEAHAMFGHTAEERQRRIAAEQQLSQEHQLLDAQQHFTVVQQHLTIELQQRATRWQTTASILGVVAVFMLIAGTAIGSRGRCHAIGRE